MSEVRQISDMEHRRSDAKSPVISSAKSISDAIRQAAALDLKECRLSRDEVAERLSFCAGRTISRAQLEAYIAPTKPHRFPLDLIADWVRVTGSRRLLDLICSEAGFYLADETEQRFAAFGRAAIERERVLQREARLKAELMEAIG